MKSIQMSLVAATLLLSGSAMAAEGVTCSAAGFDYRQYEVFVDAPTGFAFVKTPCGWRFVRQIEAAKVAEAIAASQGSPSERSVADLRVSLVQPTAD